MREKKKTKKRRKREGWAVWSLEEGGWRYHAAMAATFTGQSVDIAATSPTARGRRLSRSFSPFHCSILLSFRRLNFILLALFFLSTFFSEPTKLIIEIII